MSLTLEKLKQEHPPEASELIGVDYETPVKLTYDASAEVGSSLPFAPDTLGALMIAGAISEQHSSVSDEALTRVNERHGRSFERATVLFEDEFGNKFKHLSLKGAGPYKVEKHGAHTADEVGFTPKGFASNAAKDRIIAVSREMRKAGIDTEYPIAIGKPDAFPVIDENGGVVHMSQKDIYEAIIPGITVPDDHELNVYLRASSTPIRVDDLRLEKFGDEKFYSSDEIERVKSTLAKLAEDYKAIEPNSGFELDSEDPDSVRDFILDILAPRIGHSLAKLHGAGLTHNSLSSGNVNALGGIVDLDSVMGPALGLGDSKQLPIDALGDITALLDMHDIDSDTKAGMQKHIQRGAGRINCRLMVTSLLESGIMNPPKDDNGFRSMHDYKVPDLFAEKVLSAYAEQGSDNKFVQNILSLLQNAKNKYDKYISELTPDW